MSIEKYKRNETSQFGENGIIEEVINRLGVGASVAIEFGAPNRTFCSNIYPLIAMGWQCHYYDPNPHDPEVRPLMITEANINLLPDCTIISIDTDGMCYALWKAYKKKPAVVIIEINSGKDPDIDHFDPATGANYSIMKKLGEEKGYFLLCHTGNMIFVLKDHIDLFPDRDETFIGNV